MKGCRYFRGTRECQGSAFVSIRELSVRHQKPIKMPYTQSPRRIIGETSA